MSARIAKFSVRPTGALVVMSALVCAALLAVSLGVAQARADHGGALLSSPGDPFIQQGAKLVGGDAVGNTAQGHSVAVSADGNTVLVGGYGDSAGAGAAWVFTRSGGNWTQQASKLVGSGAAGLAAQGFSVALSGDGKTALIGGLDDNGDTGAAWVFTRTGAGWTQQGPKLVGSGANGAAAQGYSVALSSDGNTALIGAPEDNGAAGAAWVFTRSGSTWTQQGAKLVGSGAVGNAVQGVQVALSADGNTALIGGSGDDASAGAAWVFTRAAGTWSQQGAKLVGTGASGNALQGSSVALSADGSTALIGGPFDNSLTGAAWVFTRTAGNWSQLGAKIVATDAHANSVEGAAVSLSGDGNTALIGGTDGNGAGGAWVFTRSGPAWSQQGVKLAGADASPDAEQGTSVALSADALTAVVGGPTDNSSIGAAWIFGAPSISGPPRLTFGSQIDGEAGPVLWLLVVNSGQAPLTFAGPASIAGPDAGDFAIPAANDLCNGATLAPEQLCWIGVQFMPAAPGARTATLSLGASNANSSPGIALTGTGTLPNGGLPGPRGPQGPPGPRGPAGQIELVSCRAVTATAKRHGKTIKLTHQLCTTKLVTGPVQFKTTGAVSATLKRGQTVYASGIALRSSHGTQLWLTPRRSVRPGRYTLRVAHRPPAEAILR